MKEMKKSIYLLIVGIMMSVSITEAQNLGSLKKKATDAGKKTVNKTTNEKSTVNKENTTNSTNTDTKSVAGVWKIEGVVVTTEMEALKSQITEQERQYNAFYKGSIWDFKKDGTVSVAYQKSQEMNAQTGTSKYEVKGDKLYMEASGMPPEFTVSFEDGQMILTNKSQLNTIYFVFVKGK
jgi:hypothetical protein